MAKFPLRPPQNVRIARLPAQPRTGPTINRGKGNNNAATPWKFIGAVVEKFGKLKYDLACTRANSKAQFGIYHDEGLDALTMPWAVMKSDEGDGKGWYQPLLYLNPPFTNITPWARKCAEEVQLGARILLLVPASVGANWFEQWVWPYADVYSVGRMVFDNCYDKEGQLITTPYIKDLILCHFDWRNETLRTGERLLFWKEWSRG